MEPDDCGKLVLNAIKNDEFYILTDGNERDLIQARFDRLTEAIERAAEVTF
jgi:hypothetical protein